MEWLPCTHFRSLDASRLFSKKPAFAKLLTGPMPELLLPDWPPLETEALSAFLTLMPGNRFVPGTLIPTDDGFKTWLVEAYSFMRRKPRRCSQVRFGVSEVALSRPNVWLPAASFCGKPSRELWAHGVVLGTFWK